VRMHRPAFGARGGINANSPHLVSGIVITPDAHPESLDLYAGRHGENLTNPRNNCENPLDLPGFDGESLVVE